MKELFFIHVPKTAGTTIENIALDKGIKWGKHGFQPSLKKPFNETRVATWHYPLDYYNQNELNYLKERELFCVVRNPIDKIVSQYNCRWWNDEKTYINDNVIMFNEEISRMLDSKESQKDLKMIPQHRYVYLNDLKLVNTVIKYENIHQEFNQKMKEHGYDIMLDRHDNKRDGKKFTKNDLFFYNVKRIYELYRKDFDLFNYIME